MIFIKKICNEFLCDFNSKCSDYKDINEIKSGKAQKIVNMTFKYLYLFEDSRDYKESVFNNCHIAIDNYILKYFKKRLDKPENKIFDISWSNLEYDEYINIYNKIKTILSNDIELKILSDNEKKYFNSTPTINSLDFSKYENITVPNLPFFAEFCIWDFQQTLDSEIYKIKEAKKLEK